MEAHIIISKSFVYQAAYNVLTGMLLHKVKSSGPVNLALNFRSWFQSTVCAVDQLSVLLVNVCDCCLS